MKNPFLQKNFPIKWSQLTTDHVVPDIKEAIKQAGDQLDLIAAQSGELTYENTFTAFEQASKTVHEPWTLVGHLDSTCNSPELREAYNQVLPLVSAFGTEVYLREDLFTVLKKFNDSSKAQDCSAHRKRYMQEVLRDFQESGVDLLEDKKQQLKDIQKKLAAACQTFGEHVLDSTNAWEYIVTDEAQLAGLPEGAIAAAKASAKAKSKDGWLFTLHAPSWVPVLKYADSDTLRRLVWEGGQTVGHGGEYENEKLILEILTLRQQKAVLLDSDTWADKVLERRMVGSGKKAMDFTDEFFERIKVKFNADNKALEKFAANQLKSDVSPLQPWDRGYYLQKMREEELGFNEEDLRPYFGIDTVMQGMFTIVENIFGIKVTQAKAEGWHEEVKYYEVHDNNELLGAFYTDWHPRPSKRGGAWMNEFIAGTLIGGVRTPHLGIIMGNLTAPVNGKEALLSLREVETIFHEFGHLLHLILGEAEVASITGTNVKWDFVELPSQLMENFIYERISLNMLAKHSKTGEPVPEKLFQKMNAARKYRSSLQCMRQLSLGKIDLHLHMHTIEDLNNNLDELDEQVLGDYHPPYATKPGTVLRGFNHIFSDPVGYSAGYYSYKWAEVLSADVFAYLRDAGVLNPEAGTKYRQEILAKGNTEDPMILFKNLMGREPNIDALLEQDGLS